MQEGRVIAYASRSLTESEKRYAQIEKEMLSIVFNVTKFHCYVFAKETVIYTDHKPLELLFRKPLLSAPMRIQKMMLKLQWYSLKVNYRKGIEMKISGALSRAYLPFQTKDLEDSKHSDLVSMITISKIRSIQIYKKEQRQKWMYYIVL